MIYSNNEYRLREPQITSRLCCEKNKQPVDPHLISDTGNEQNNTVKVRKGKMKCGNEIVKKLVSVTNYECNLK